MAIHDFLKYVVILTTNLPSKGRLSVPTGLGFGREHIMFTGRPGRSNDNRSSI